MLTLGNPKQTVRVLPSTRGQATWVIMTEACQLEPFDPTCNGARGSLVNLNQFTTRRELGVYELSQGSNLNGAYGLDSIAVSPNPNGPSLDNQIVVGIQTNRYRLGFLGLNQQPTNISNYTQPYPSLLTTLKSQKIVSS